jgi:hypothetical protein
MEYDRGLTVVQAQFIQRVQSLLLDLFLSRRPCIDYMLSRYGQANSRIRIIAGYSQIHLRTIATKSSGTSGVEAPVQVVWGVSCYQPVFVLVVYQAHQCTDLWRQDKIVTVSEISHHLEWSELVKLGRELVEGTLKSLLIFLLWIDHLTDL